MRVLMLAPSQAIACPPTIYGGAEAVTFSLLVGLKSLGIEADLVAPNGSENPAGLLIPTGKPDGKWGGDWAAYERVYKQILLQAKNGKKAAWGDREYDVVHSHVHAAYPESPWPAYMPFLEGASYPIVHTMHGITTWPKPPPTPKPGLMTLTPWHRAITKQLIGVDSRVSPNAIVANSCRFTSSHEKSDVYLCFGLLAPHKGQLAAIELAKELDLKLIVAGGTFGTSPDYVQQVKNECAKAGFDFIPDPNTQEKKYLLGNARALIQPFLVPEAWSLLAPEALLSGTDVYMTQHGGLATLGCPTIEDLRKGVPPRPADQCRQSAMKYDCLEVAKTYRSLYEDAQKSGW